MTMEKTFFNRLFLFKCSFFRKYFRHIYSTNNESPKGFVFGKTPYPYKSLIRLRKSSGAYPVCFPKKRVK